MWSYIRSCVVRLLVATIWVVGTSAKYLNKLVASPSFQLTMEQEQQEVVDDDKTSLVFPHTDTVLFCYESNASLSVNDETSLRKAICEYKRSPNCPLTAHDLYGRLCSEFRLYRKRNISIVERIAFAFYQRNPSAEAPEVFPNKITILQNRTILEITGTPLIHPSLKEEQEGGDDTAADNQYVRTVLSSSPKPMRL